MSTVRNIVLVALMQVGVIVGGVLGAGVSHKWWTSFGIALPPSTLLLMNYGVIALVMPLIWGVCTLRLRQTPEVPEEIKALVFFSGILLLAFLCLIVGYAVLEPWLNVDWGMHHGDE